MFSLRNKIDPILNTLIEKDSKRVFRVLIHCKKFKDRIETKLKSHKCSIYYNIDNINCLCTDASSQLISRLIEYPEIDYIALDDFAEICAARNVCSGNNVSSLFVQNLKFTGKGVCVGIIDTGVYPHKDLKSPFSKITKFIDLINGLNYPYDDNGHGTFISGLIAGSGSSSKGTYRGIASGASIYMIKAFEANGRTYVSAILKALTILIMESKENNIRVICLPFETFTENSFINSMFEALFKLACDNNIAVIVPSGSNKNSKNSIAGIAALNYCATISGIKSGSEMTSYPYSSSGPCGKPDKPDLCAACTDLCSLNSDISYISERNGAKVYARELKTPYTTYTGTSCSAAYVAGILAILFEKSPDITYKDGISMLKTSCTLLSLPKWQQGAGVINLQNLLN